VKITDTEPFFEDVPRGVCVALDLRRTETGTVRYFDVTSMREEARKPGSQEAKKRRS